MNLLLGSIKIKKSFHVHILLILKPLLVWFLRQYTKNSKNSNHWFFELKCQCTFYYTGGLKFTLEPDDVL